MISKDRTERDGLTSFEALSLYMIEGAEENLEILQLNQAMSRPKSEHGPTKYFVELLLA